MAIPSDSEQIALKSFLTSLADVPWLSKAGENHDAAIVAGDLINAWDGWNAEMLAVQSPETVALERIAVSELGEDGVNAIFDIVGSSIDSPLRVAMEHYYDTHSYDATNTNRSIWPEWLDTMKRDLSWAAIEAIFSRPGFFTDVLQH